MFLYTIPPSLKFYIEPVILDFYTFIFVYFMKYYQQCYFLGSAEIALSMSSFFSRAPPEKVTQSKRCAHHCNAKVYRLVFFNVVNDNVLEKVEPSVIPMKQKPVAGPLNIHRGYPLILINIVMLVSSASIISFSNKKRIFEQQDTISM